MEVGSRVELHGLRQKAVLNGAAGACESWDEDLAAWEVRLDDGTAVFARPEHLRQPALCGWAEELFGHQLLTPRGLRPSAQVLASKRAVLLYFRDRWCEGVPALTDGYLNYEGSDVEVVFVSSDRHESAADFQELCDGMPWACFVGGGEAAEQLMKRFDCTFVPFVPLLRGSDGGLARRNVRGDIESREDFGSLLDLWQL